MCLVNFLAPPGMCFVYVGFCKQFKQVVEIGNGPASKCIDRLIYKLLPFRLPMELDLIQFNSISNVNRTEQYHVTVVLDATKDLLILSIG